MSLSRVENPCFLLFLLVFQAVFILILYRGGASSVFRGFLESQRVLDYSKSHDVYTNLSLLAPAGGGAALPYCSERSPIAGTYRPLTLPDSGCCSSGLLSGSKYNATSFQHLKRDLCENASPHLALCGDCVGPRLLRIFYTCQCSPFPLEAGRRLAPLYCGSQPLLGAALIQLLCY